jgi:hypothetical protein
VNRSDPSGLLSKDRRTATGSMLQGVGTSARSFGGAYVRTRSLAPASDDGETITVNGARWVRDLNVELASIGDLESALRERPEDLPRCLHAPSAEEMSRATNTALRRIYGNRSDQPRTSSLSSEFSRVDRLPDFSQGGWHSTTSSHADQAWEQAIPGSNTYVIKFYIGDSNFGGANTATITHPTGSVEHFSNFFPFLIGSPVNARNAADFLDRPCY